MIGEKFEREPCQKCGETLFYVNNRKCVACSQKWSLAAGVKRRALNPHAVNGKPRGPENKKQIYNDTYQDKKKLREKNKRVILVFGISKTVYS